MYGLTDALQEVERERDAALARVQELEAAIRKYVPIGDVEEVLQGGQDD